jgi:hypothetical protein
VPRQTPSNRYARELARLLAPLLLEEMRFLLEKEQPVPRICIQCRRKAAEESQSTLSPEREAEIAAWAEERLQRIEEMSQVSVDFYTIRETTKRLGMKANELHKQMKSGALQIRTKPLYELTMFKKTDAYVRANEKP